MKKFYGRKFLLKKMSHFPLSQKIRSVEFFLKSLCIFKSSRQEQQQDNYRQPHKHNNYLKFYRHASTVHPSSSVLRILKSPLNLNRARCYKQVVMLVMLVKPADISPHECVSTYFLTGLRTFLDIYRVQSLAEHLTHRTASRSWTLQLLNTK